MKKSLLSFVLFLVVLLGSGCAASYKAINPRELYFTAHSMRDGIEVSYKYNVLQEKGNKKLAKKEGRRDIQVIAIKLTNNTAQVVNVKNDLDFFAGDKPIYPMQPVDIKNHIRQSVASYLPYLLLTFVSVVFSNGNSVAALPVGLVLGPGVTAGNMAVAATANKRFLQELTDFNILNRDVRPGETVTGIIGVRDSGFGPITVRLKSHE